MADRDMGGPIPADAPAGVTSCGAVSSLSTAGAGVAPALAFSGEAYFSSLRGAVIVPLRGRAWSLNPARCGAGPSLTVALSPIEDAALLAALRGWGG